MLGTVLKRIFGTKNERFLASLEPILRRTNELEPKIQAMSDEELRRQTSLFKERIARGEPLESIESEAYAVVREASRRTLGMRHFDVQIIGGAVLHRGMIAEMKTGEGKTLVATLPAYLNALTGLGVHIVTVNDYLARRDSEWMGQVYTFLGLSVGVVTSIREGTDEKVKAYLADITYGQNNEFGFDYLRDNMKHSLDDQFQRGHNFAIVDEVDSILIDEARTPLIISGPAEEATDKYYKIDKIIPNLKETEDYEIELRTKHPTLTEAGITKCERLLGVENLYDPRYIDLVHHVNNGLLAHTRYERDKDYVVKDGKVIIVDEFTGRLMDGRRWSSGLHQAVEAKEGVAIERENQTLATITFQNYFRQYKKLAGMTGTADTEAVEFKKIYNLEVSIIPTNRPMVRADHTDKVFRSQKEKYEQVAKDIIEIHSKGQPILVGTVSIERSEMLSKMLSRHGIQHNVLNAKHHEREAEIVAQAGRVGAVTIATNMAGRGTDIILGGNPEFMAAAEAGTRNREDPDYQEALAEFKELCAEDRDKVVGAGGVFIIGTERHEARRIDNQLRGRSGRQGDPGESRFYVSLEDDLMRRFGGEKIQGIMQKFGWEEGVAIDGRLISRTIENAQIKVERMHFEYRKQIIEYDDVMAKQRQVVYNLRNKILHNEDVHTEIREMLIDLVEEAVLEVCDERTKPMEWEISRIADRMHFLTRALIEFPENMLISQQPIFDVVKAQILDTLERRAGEQEARLKEIESIAAGTNIISGFGSGRFDFGSFEQSAILENLDRFWNMHLQEMDELRDAIGLRGYAQKNPLYEYQTEGFLLFQQMLRTLREAIIREVFHQEFVDPQGLEAYIEAEKKRREKLERQMNASHQSVLEGGEDEDGNAKLVKNPDDSRARLQEQKKARRKKK